MPFSFDYKAHEHGSRVRTYYFHSHKDPWTPMRNVSEHLKAQTKAERFVTIHGLASHGPLVHSLKKCRDKIWKNILSLSDDEVFGKTLSKCEASYLLKFDHIPAGKPVP